MKDRIFIVINKDGYVQTYKREGFNLAAGQKAFTLDLEVPDEAFKKPPMPRVTMKIPTEALTHVFDVEVDGTLP